MSPRARAGRLALFAVVLVAGLAAAAWWGLAYVPGFYVEAGRIDPARRREVARAFVAQGLQLRNDIVNESRWQASFTADEVNAWMAEDLMKLFADLVPPGVRDPRFAFEPDRLTLAFQLDQGPFRSVVWVVARIDVPEPNEVAIRIEKIRAGVLPISPETLVKQLGNHALARGLDLKWEHDGPELVARIRYRANVQRRDISLEHVLLTEGRVILEGRSESPTSQTVLRLPDRKALQSTFNR
jgi:hypothetical protein